MISYARFTAQNSLSDTAQRRILFELIKKQESHFSLEHIFSEAKKSFPRIGIATVYRFLNILSKSRIIKEHHFREETLYEVETRQTHHDHLICEKCGAIVEFTNEEIEALQEKIAKNNNFILSDHKLELYGICEKCQEVDPVEEIVPLQ